MEKRKLGHSSLETAPIIFGGNVFGWTIDESTSFSLLDAFVADGFNTIDTADIYSKWKPGNQGGESETIIGNWLEKRGGRENLLIATKAGADFGNGPDVRSENIIRSAEASLKRLKTDYIDLYQTHYDNPSTPVEETLEAYSKLVDQGKVRVIGTSNMTPERIHESINVSAEKGFARYETLQPEYNLYDREGFEAKYFPVAKEHGLSVIPYYSLAAGFLTGKYRSEADFGKSARGAGMKKYLNPKGDRILQALDAVAAKHDAQVAEVSLAWLIAQDTVAAAIASATSEKQLQSFAKAVALKLDQQDLSMLTNAGQ